MSVNLNPNQTVARSTIAPARSVASRSDNASRSRFARVLDSATASANPTAPSSSGTTRPTPSRAETTAAPAATTTAGTATGHAAEPSNPNDSGPNVFGLVTPPQPVPDPPPAAAPVEDRPTVESVFGSDPWLGSVSGYSNGGPAYSYNTNYFATQATAEKVAQLLGGKVVLKNAMVGDTGPFYQSAPNYMVELPNGHLVNPGLTATYYTHGWTQSQIDTMLGYDRNV